MRENSNHKKIQCIKDSFQLIITLQEHQLKVVAESVNNHQKFRAIYTFDALPLLLQQFQNIQGVFKFLKEIKETDHLQVKNQGLQIKISLSMKVKKIILLEWGIEKIISSDEHRKGGLQDRHRKGGLQKLQKMQRMQNQLIEVTKESAKWKQIAQNLYKQLNKEKQIKNQLLTQSNFKFQIKPSQEVLFLKKEVQNFQQAKQKIEQNQQKAIKSNKLHRNPKIDEKILVISTQFRDQRLKRELIARDIFNLKIKGLEWCKPHEQIWLTQSMCIIKLTCIVEFNFEKQIIMKKIQEYLKKLRSMAEIGPINMNFTIKQL